MYMSLALLSPFRPSSARLSALVHAHADAALTYDAVGGTREGAPGSPLGPRGALAGGWSTDAQRRVIGHGPGAFHAAVGALRSWSQFDLSWVWPLRTDVPIAEGQLFAFLARALGIWSINVCRVVYVVDEQSDERARFGFAYGTLGPHSVQGEERFLIEWDRRTDEVSFEIRKFSRPSSALLRALGPITRWIQARFTRDALQRLSEEVSP